MRSSPPPGKGLGGPEMESPGTKRGRGVPVQSPSRRKHLGSRDGAPSGKGGPGRSPRGSPAGPRGCVAPCTVVGRIRPPFTPTGHPSTPPQPGRAATQPVSRGPGPPPQGAGPGPRGLIPTGARPTAGAWWDPPSCRAAPTFPSHPPGITGSKNRSRAAMLRREEPNPAGSTDHFSAPPVTNLACPPSQPAAGLQGAAGLHPASRCWLFAIPTASDVAIVAAGSLPRGVRGHIDRSHPVCSRRRVGVNLLLFYLFPPFFSPLCWGSVSRFPPLPTIPPSHATEDAPAATKFPPNPFSPLFRTRWAPPDNLGVGFPGCRASPIPTWDFQDGLDGTEQHQPVGLQGWWRRARVCQELAPQLVAKSTPALFGGIFGEGLFRFLALFREGIEEGVWSRSPLRSCRCCAQTRALSLRARVPPRGLLAWHG